MEHEKRRQTVEKHEELMKKGAMMISKYSKAPADANDGFCEETKNPVYTQNGLNFFLPLGFGQLLMSAVRLTSALSVSLSGYHIL